MSKQIRKSISIFIIAAFMGTSIKSPAFAQLSEDPMPFMSKPGVMVPLSPEYTPAYLKGIVIHPEDALKFDFIIYKGDKELTDDQKRDEYTKLTKYFLASLAIPDDDQWVNLSPYEKDRIIKDDFGKTEMGRDLLAQDYMLKQITASLIYPEDSLGKKFWNKVYSEAQKQYGTTDIPVNTFNKVWILPDDALIYEKGNTAYVLKNHLRVMLEEDYLSLKKHAGIQSAPAINKTHTIASKIIKEIVIPELEREVNEDKNFATVRQVFSGVVLAAWYKRALKESLLGKIYMNKSRVKGVDQNPQNNEVIYRQYLRAYKKGVFNFIKDDVDKYTNETIPRKYFSGGLIVTPSEASIALGHEVLHVTNTAPSGEQGAAMESDAVNNKVELVEEAEEESFVVNAQQPAAAGSAIATPKTDTAMIGDIIKYEGPWMGMSTEEQNADITKKINQLKSTGLTNEQAYNAVITKTAELSFEAANNLQPGDVIIDDDLIFVVDSRQLRNDTGEETVMVTGLDNEGNPVTARSHVVQKIVDGKFKPSDVSSLLSHSRVVRLSDIADLSVSRNSTSGRVTSRGIRLSDDQFRNLRNRVISLGLGNVTLPQEWRISLGTEGNRKKVNIISVDGQSMDLTFGRAAMGHYVIYYPDGRYSSLHTGSIITGPGDTSFSVRTNEDNTIFIDGRNSHAPFGIEGEGVSRVTDAAMNAGSSQRDDAFFSQKLVEKKVRITWELGEAIRFYLDRLKTGNPEVKNFEPEALESKEDVGGISYVYDGTRWVLRGNESDYLDFLKVLGEDKTLFKEETLYKGFERFANIYLSQDIASSPKDMAMTSRDLSSSWLSHLLINVLPYGGYRGTLEGPISARILSSNERQTAMGMLRDLVINSNHLSGTAFRDFVDQEIESTYSSQDEYVKGVVHLLASDVANNNVDFNTIIDSINFLYHQIALIDNQAFQRRLGDNHSLVSEDERFSLNLFRNSELFDKSGASKFSLLPPSTLKEIVVETNTYPGDYKIMEGIIFNPDFGKELKIFENIQNIRLDNPSYTNFSINDEQRFGRIGILLRRLTNWVRKILGVPTSTDQAMNIETGDQELTAGEKKIPVVRSNNEGLEITTGNGLKNIGNSKQYTSAVSSGLVRSPASVIKSPSSVIGKLGIGSAQDRAAVVNINPNLRGGIDFNSANLSLQIKRDGHGVPLPISQQDLQNIKIDGLIPVIIDIKPATSLPIFAELQNTAS